MVSADLISRVRDVVLAEVSDCQNRALEPMFPVRRQGDDPTDHFPIFSTRGSENCQVKNKAVCVAPGVTP